MKTIIFLVAALCSTSVYAAVTNDNPHFNPVPGQVSWYDIGKKEYVSNVAPMGPHDTLIWQKHTVTIISPNGKVQVLRRD